jgi:hypothetical protein
MADSHPDSPATPEPPDREHEESEGLAVLLKRFRHFLFAPGPDRLSKAGLDLQVQDMLQRTRDVRPRAAARRTAIWGPIPLRALGLAALVLLSVGLALWHLPFGLRSKPTSYSVAASANRVGILGCARLLATATYRSVDPRSESIALLAEGSRALGYLFPEGATVDVVRTDGESARVQTPVLVVSPGDELAVTGPNPATVLFERQVVILPSPGDYRVKEDGHIEAAAGGASPPRLEAGMPAIAISPSSLLAAVTYGAESPPAAPAVVLSPRGATFSQTPEVVWTGSGTDMYTVSVISAEPAAARMPPHLGPSPVRAAEVAWRDLGWPPLPRDTSWKMRITRDGVVVSDTANQFHVLSARAAEALSAKLAAVERLLPQGDARDFARMSILMTHEPPCAAEARRIAMDIRRRAAAPENLILLKALEHTSAQLELSEAARQAGQRIREVLTAQAAAATEETP